jgi:hypothetical protein
MSGVNTQQTMVVTVRDRAAEAPWGSGATTVATRNITIPVVCRVCGAPRGAPRSTRQHEDGVTYYVHTWTNPCGHVDLYADLIREANLLSWALTVAACSFTPQDAAEAAGQGLSQVCDLVEHVVTATMIGVIREMPTLPVVPPGKSVTRPRPVDANRDSLGWQLDRAVTALADIAAALDIGEVDDPALLGLAVQGVLAEARESSDAVKRLAWQLCMSARKQRDGALSRVDQLSAELARERAVMEAAFLAQDAETKAELRIAGTVALMQDRMVDELFKAHEEAVAEVDRLTAERDQLLRLHADVTGELGRVTAERTSALHEADAMRQRVLSEAAIQRAVAELERVARKTTDRTGEAPPMLNYYDMAAAALRAAMDGEAGER